MKLTSKNEYKIRLAIKNKKPTYQVYRKIWILPIVKVFYETCDPLAADTYRDNCNLISTTTQQGEL